MFGINYIKFDSMTYVIQYKNGIKLKEGRGLSFFYFAPNTSIVAIPLGSSDVNFIFTETTNDFQEISIQGQITYKIKDPIQLAELLDFTVDDKGKYKKDDFEKLNERIINEAQTATAGFIREIGLVKSISSSKEIENVITQGLNQSNTINQLGIQPLSVSILAIKPSPETKRALEAKTRESLLKEADSAIYERRNFSVEQERMIKQSELNTEIAVEEKKKEIAEKQMERAVAEAKNERQIREMKVDADISVETKKQDLIDKQVSNEKKTAEANGYAIEAMVKPYKDMDWRLINALTSNSTDSGSQIALAFRELAENAGKIGTLNISPELLETLVNNGVRKNSSRK
ncbi:SPFH domain-containing protein [Marinigracilibium pacificum]|uniref:Membrane protease subunit, stomatin/prohibitin n=1 Tax=Marinigracilibium pacificum TaxID=2729599 RepID=A0A848J2F1_9BACT|nr:SPFH domain-containing protein [Marinigracilibium pacificum]NMM49901.1 membrane protease subunit, stomatin/prohibitin [Marinigracilibium pacificum]